MMQPDSPLNSPPDVDETASPDSSDTITDVGKVEAVAATLELPRGLVDADRIRQWREDVTKRGWSLDDHRDGRYLLRHDASGYRADVLVLPFHPDDPQHPVFGSSEDDASLRYACSTVSLSDPEGSGLLAHANLADAGPDGAVSWLLDRPVPSPDSETPEAFTTTATASPFRRRGWFGLRDRLRLRSRPAALVGLLLSTALVGTAGWFILRRSPR